jgi:hypothetical protein
VLGGVTRGDIRKRINSEYPLLESHFSVRHPKSYRVTSSEEERREESRKDVETQRYIMQGIDTKILGSTIT